MNPSYADSLQDLVRAYCDIVLVMDSILEQADLGEYYLTDTEYKFLDAQVSGFLGDLEDEPELHEYVESLDG